MCKRAIDGIAREVFYQTLVPIGLRTTLDALSL
jgi:hypothetical protein